MRLPKNITFCKNSLKFLGEASTSASGQNYSIVKIASKFLGVPLKIRGQRSKLTSEAALLCSLSKKPLKYL